MSLFENKETFQMSRLAFLSLTSLGLRLCETFRIDIAATA